METVTAVDRRSFILACCLASLPMSGSLAADSLSELKGDRRLIVAFGENGNAEVERFLELARDQACELNDRDIDAYLVTGQGIDPVTDAAPALDESSAEYLRSLRHSSDTEFALVLIGKDGGDKSRADSADELLTFLALIDGMPMRQREIEERGANC